MVVVLPCSGGGDKLELVNIAHRFTLPFDYVLILEHMLLVDSNHQQQWHHINKNFVLSCRPLQQQQLVTLCLLMLAMSVNAEDDSDLENKLKPAETASDMLKVRMESVPACSAQLTSDAI